MTEEEQTQKINEILIKSWTDTDFKHKLFTDTTAMLKAEGIEIPEGYTVNVHENTGNSLHFVLPPNPNGELSDLELEAVAGGKGGELAEFAKVFELLEDGRKQVASMMENASSITPTPSYTQGGKYI